MAERNRGERQRREQKAADKEMARLQKQIEAAQQRSRHQQQQVAAWGHPSSPPPPLPVDEPPPLPLPSDDPPPLPPGLPPVEAATAPPLPPDVPPPCSGGVGSAGQPESAATGISFGLGKSGAARGRGAPIALGSLKRPGGPVSLAGRPLKVGCVAAPMAAGFGLDSDDDEEAGS
ncbi:hypothetical protein Vretimale_18937 [Volvox reticuliferus]|nr:hypothetical protein Vretifemale_17267 [Volvox reticuliferus]GIM16280.1 hypothetical protein Vretimale_18937 [Volvox reticuliferus]